MTKNMVDISSNNHAGNQDIDWAAVKAGGIQAVMIKATEGVNYTNPWLERDALGAKAQGLEIGYYHFAHPGLRKSIAEARFCANAIKNLPRSLGVALDLEVTEGRNWYALSLYARNFLNALPNWINQKVLYSNPDYLSHWVRAPWGHLLWLASWDKQPSSPVWAWQSGTGAVQGIQGITDIDTLYV